MRVSFVIPAYNEESYLPDCLASILRQTREAGFPCEIVVVNNASTDRTREIAESFAGVTVVDEPRKGITYARQAGVEASTGDLIANVDADSRLPRGWLQQMVQQFEGHPKLLAVSGPLHYYDLTVTRRFLVAAFYRLAWMTYLLNRYVLQVGSMVQGGNFVVTRTALEAIGGFNVAISFYGEDTDLARRLSKIGDVSFLLKLKMLSSARRLHKEGLLTTASRYTINYLWTTFRERPYSTEYRDIREQFDG